MLFSEALDSLTCNNMGGVLEHDFDFEETPRKARLHEEAFLSSDIRLDTTTADRKAACNVFYSQR